MKVSNNGPHMFTVADAIKLLNNSYGKQGLSPQSLQTDSALKGDYALTDTQALNELERIKSGKHALDNPTGHGLGSIAGGKLPGHPTFSNESPYAVKGLKSAEAGEWHGSEGNWTYIPSKAQFERDPKYMDKLMNYFDREKNNGINRIVLPNGQIIE